MGTKWLITEDALREYFSDTQETKKDVRISLQGITSGSKVTDKDIEKAKEIHAKGINTFLLYLRK